MHLPKLARLGIDFGKARTGVAWCGSIDSVVLPVGVFESSWTLVEELAELVSERNIGIVYVGMPRKLGGGYGESARLVMSLARELTMIISPIPVHLVDERLTTVSAHQKLHAAGKKSRDFKPIVDQQAAMEILEHAIHTEKVGGSPAGVLVK